MKKAVMLFLAAVILMTSSSCLYIDVQYPMDDDYTNTELGRKTGKASMYSVLGLVSWGNAGSKAAAEAGGVKVLKHADQQYFAVFWPFYQRWTTVIYGD